MAKRTNEKKPLRNKMYTNRHESKSIYISWVVIKMTYCPFLPQHHQFIVHFGLIQMAYYN